MIETKVKVLASVYTALLMTALLSLLLLGGFQMKAKPVKGSTMKAIMVDVSQLQSRKKSKKTTKPPVKTPQAKKPKIKKQTTKKVPVKKEVKKEKKAPPRIVKKTPKVDTEAIKKEKEEARKRQKKREEIQKKRKELERIRKKEKEYLQELQKKIKNETNKKPENKNLGFKKGVTEADKINRLRTAWQLAVIAKVHSKWSKPASKTKNLECYVKVKQIPGGGVIDATISSPCNANTLEKRSIIAAIKKADPLPYKGFEKVFDRNATFIFNLDK